MEIFVARMTQASPVREVKRDPASPRLAVAEHLAEIRRRLAICLLTLVISAGLGFRWAGELLAWLKRPAGALLPHLAFFSPAEGMVAYLKLAVAFGLVAASPVILYQAWAFVRPGLTRRERAAVLAGIWWGGLLFVVGAAVGYRVLLPVFLKVLLSVGTDQLTPVISVSRYVSFALGVIVWCGALCELPVVIAMLSRLGLVTPAALRRRRAMALVAVLIIAALITPTTDAISLLLMAAPLVLLYELSILIARASARL